ncbi:MAG: Tex family protein [Myxococcota bacterium]
MSVAFGSRVARDLRLPAAGVEAVLRQLDDGGTVPFIARYRKEATGGLDEVQIRAVAERRAELEGLEARRAAILRAIGDRLTPALQKKIDNATTKTELEDLYAPFKAKRKTRAETARQRGLARLAETMWRQPREGAPATDARAFVGEGVPDVEAALAGARDICAERIADDVAVRRHVRETYRKHARFTVKKVPAKRKERTKFDDHDGRDEAYRRIASHRYLALCRGEAEGVLRVRLALDDDGGVQRWVAGRAGLRPRSPWAEHLRLAATDALKRLVYPRTETELRGDLKARADRDAVDVFAQNLRELLLAPPFGGRPVVAIDPGQRTGCKAVALDGTGRLVAHETLFLVHGAQKLAAAQSALRRLVGRVKAEAVAVGNGTHGRETVDFVRDTLDADDVVVASVSESGASIYSASDQARRELGGVDVVVRGAVSIGRRMQDPLAELVKLDPATIGVGQYQHDVAPALLAGKLDAVVEDCVNGVGVALNTASAPLLARVAGVGPKQAAAIVAHRERNGRFLRRDQLRAVKGVGDKTFEQAAGFLRIVDGDDPLDASAVHPEQYPLVARMAADVGVAVEALVGAPAAVARIDRDRYGDEVGAFTLDDILTELMKPGRDPRPPFEPPAFRDDVRTLDDLTEGMTLEGVVTNVTDFGAFVDIGVKQDGLIHISQLADHFVRHPSDVVRVGARLRVRVLSVDPARKRIALSAKSIR